ncbi:hypothetical protein D3C71_1560910 [compost metagenome]
MQQEEATAAQARADRLNHRQRGGHRDGGVERVAALGEDFHAGIGGQRVTAGNHRAIGVRCACLRRIGRPRSRRHHQRKQHQGTGNDLHADGFSGS